MYRIFLSFAKSLRSLGVTELIFELLGVKAKIKGVFSRSYCCYGNLLCHKNDNVPSSWADIKHSETGIIARPAPECSLGL